MEWTALLFDGNPRALLHIMARAWVFSPVGRWRAWAVPSWAAPMAACACRQEAGLGRAGASVGREIESSFIFPVNLLMLMQFSFQAKL